MRQSLSERCAAQIRNEEALRKGHMLEFESVIKLGALMYVNAGREADPERIKECKNILKERAGIFSNFRGSLEYIVLVKMSLSDNPSAYIDGVMRVYEQLKSGRVLPGELLAMAATTIYENCPAESRTMVVEKTREAYAGIKEQHRFLTDESDMAFVALMILAGLNPNQAVNEAERLFGMLKDGFKVSSDAAQTAAMVLALSNKPADQKVKEYIDLFEACKTAGHATAKDKKMAVYATLTDVDASQAEIVAEISEVDEWLKQQKGYGMMGIGASMRRLFAATFVLEDRQAGASAAASSTATAVVQALVEEVVLIIVMLIVMSAVISSSVQTSHH